MTRTKHVHKMKRVDIGKKGSYIVYKCMDPLCSWYQSPELALGKMTICWACGSEMILTRDRFIAKPTCCTRKIDQLKNDAELDGIKDLLSGVGGEDES